jgi:hypothetical protein
MTLPEIIDSKTDSTILSFFLVAPARSFSILEVSRRLNIPHQKASHSLNKIAESGLLKGFSKRSKKYFLLNPGHKLLPEVRRQFSKDAPKYRDELFFAIKKLGDVKAAFLSGIFTGHPNLPVDLLLVGKINLKKLADFLKALEKMMGQEINYSVMTVREFELRRDTFDKFIKDIFDYSHIAVCDTLTKKTK